MSTVATPPPLNTIIETDKLRPVTDDGVTLFVDNQEPSFFSVIDPSRIERFNTRAKQDYDRGSKNVEWRSPQISYKLFDQYLSDPNLHDFFPGLTNQTVNIIDIGTANGYSLNQYRTGLKEEWNLNAYGIGVDVSNEILKQGIQNHRLDCGVQASTDILRHAKPKAVDLIKCIGVSAMLKDQEFETLVEQSHDALRKGGALNLSFAMKMSTGKPRGDIRRNVDEVCEIVERAGLQIHSTDEVDDAWIVGERKPKPVANGYVLAYKPS